MKNTLFTKVLAIAIPVFMLLTYNGWGQEEPLPNCVFISEYIEGSSNNKALELYNGCDAPVDLSNYQVQVFVNGNTDPTYTFEGEGTLEPGEVLVICNSGAGFPELCNTTASVANFNGDDAIALINLETGDTMDIIGVVGVDPGTAWEVNDGAATTQNHTLVRRPEVLAGNTDWTVVRNEWIALEQDVRDSLGSHTVFKEPVTARVQVVHNAADPAAEVVDIYVDINSDTVKVEDFAFRTATPFLELPAEEEITIVVAPGSSESIEEGIASFPVTLEDGQSYNVVANGVLNPDDFAPNPEGLDIAFTLLTAADAREAAEDGESVDLRVLHGATDAPQVGVNANGATVIPRLSYGDFVGYLSVPAGSYQLDITPAGDPENVLLSFEADVSSLGGGAALVAASGFLDPAANQDGAAFALIVVLPDGTVIELPQTPAEPAVARVQVLHNAADPAAEVVDIYVDINSDTVKVEDFAFRTATPFLNVPAEEEITIVIAPGASESIEEGIASFPVTLEDGQSYHVVANGVLNPDDFAPNPEGLDIAFTLLTAADAREAAEDGESVDLRVLHGATDAPNVGVNANGATVIPGFSYGDFAGYLSVPADFYQLDITPGGDPETILLSYDADLSGLGGGAALVAASGFLDPAANQDGAAFALIAVLPDGTVIELPQIPAEPAVARVQVLHNAADPAAEVVDVYVDINTDTVKLEDFAFRTATPFLDLPAEEEITIVVAPGSSESIEEGIASFPVTLEDGQSYHVVANGVLNPDDFAPNPEGLDIGFTLLAAADARDVGEDVESVDVRVLHGATDAPNVGVNANGGTVIPGFSYGDFSDYLSIPPIIYQLDITPGGDPETVLLSFEADLSGLEGGAALVAASGFLDPAANQDGAAFALIAVLPDGTVIELPQIPAEPAVARVQVLHNAADPAAEVVDVYVDINTDTVKLEDFAFRTATPFLELPAEEEITIVVAPGTSESIEEGIASFPVTLEDGQSYHVVANGVLNPDDFAPNPEGLDIAFTLLTAADAREAAEDGESVDLRVLHGATDAPQVGVNANGATVIPRLSYGDFVGYLSVPAGSYQLDITPAGDPENVLLSFEADLSSLGGGAALVAASGFLDPAANQDGAAFALIVVLPDGTVIELPQTPIERAVARIQVLHNAADPAAEVVDIYVDINTDTLKVEDFAFRTATPFVELPAEEEITIIVAPGSSESIAEGIASFPVTLEDGQSYHVVANGVLNPDDFAPNPEGLDIAFTLLTAADAREAAEDGESVDLRVLHGATDAPNVGVNANGATVIPGFSYGDFAGYLSVPADFYQLDITPGGDPETVLLSFDADLSGLGGGAALVAASGFLDPSANQDGAAFALIAVLPDGTVIELPQTQPDEPGVFTLVNGDGEVLIADLQDGDTIDLADYPLDRFNIEVIPDADTVGRVDFLLEGPVFVERAEIFAPYYLFADLPIARQLEPGSYQLTATPNTRRGSSGESLEPLSISFEVVNSASFAGIQLVSRDDEVLDEAFEDGAVINLDSFPGVRFNVFAETDPAVVGSVVFELTGPLSRTGVENQAPYYLFGPSNLGRELPIGMYTLTITPYNEIGGNGFPGETVTINFEVTEGDMPGIRTVPQAGTLHADIEAEVLNVAVAPNPANTGAYLRLRGSAMGTVHARIINQQGAVVKEMVIVKEDVDFDVPVDLSNLNAGMYFIQFFLDDHQSSTRLIITR